LGQLFAITKNAKLGFSSEDFFPTKERSLSADASQSVIVEGHLAKVLSCFERESLSHGR
jgi:hypothetical protein